MAAGGFKFNFISGGTTTVEEQHVTVKSDTQEHHFVPATLADYLQWDMVPITYTNVDGNKFAVSKVQVNSDRTASLMGDSNLAATDLVPGKYEGGFKLWEGANDLIQVMLKQYGVPRLASKSEDPASETLQGKRVLELGCGHGLPGIVAMVGGASVVFHDFNPEVLKGATYPNVSTAIKEWGIPQALQQCRFVSGDFESVCKSLAAENLEPEFDLVVTSESIYNSQSALQILAGCKACMKRDAVLLVASKSHYFGVGGGLAAFKKLVEEDSEFAMEVQWRSDDGASNIREVLALRRITS